MMSPAVTVRVLYRCYTIVLNKLKSSWLCTSNIIDFILCLHEYMFDYEYSKMASK